MPFITMKSLKLSIAKLRRPPALLTFAALLIFLLFVLGGGVHMLLNPPQASLSFINPSLQDQYLTEGFAAAALIFVGFAGFALIYEATKNIFNPSYAVKLLAIGLILALVAVVALHWMLINKAHWLFQVTQGLSLIHI